MKLKYFGCFLFLLLLFSCKEDEVDYGYGSYLVEVVTSQGNGRFCMDNGNLLDCRSCEKGMEYEAGERVYLMFSYLKDDTENTVREIAVHSAVKVPLGDLIMVDAEKIGLLKEDPIRLESIWLGSRYINMLLYVEFNSQPHRMALVCKEFNDKEDKIELYFTHDRDSDPPGAPVKSIISFDLSNVLGEPSGTQDIVIHINTSNYGRKTYQFLY